MKVIWNLLWMFEPDGDETSLGCLHLFAFIYFSLYSGVSSGSSSYYRNVCLIFESLSYGSFCGVSTVPMSARTYTISWGWSLYCTYSMNILNSSIHSSLSLRWAPSTWTYLGPDCSLLKCLSSWQGPCLCLAPSIYLLKNDHPGMVQFCLKTWHTQTIQACKTELCWMALLTLLFKNFTIEFVYKVGSLWSDAWLKLYAIIPMSLGCFWFDHHPSRIFLQFFYLSVYCIQPWG